jgi:hypothetical protein
VIGQLGREAACVTAGAVVVRIVVGRVGELVLRPPFAIPFVAHASSVAQAADRRRHAPARTR